MSVDVICADSVQAIAGMESNSFDLVILDPDYQDWQRLCDEGFIEQAVRVTKPTGNIICFTKQPFDFALRNYIQPWFRREFVWTFTNGGAWVSNKMPLVSYQKIYWLVKSKDFYVNVRTGLDYPEATKSFKRTVKQFGGWESEGKEFVKSEEGTWIRDHYHFNKPNTAAIPSKPLELIKIIVQCFSPPNGLVFDPFWGSGTTGKACEQLERNALGIEIKPERVGND
jgi:site-specific DNA-methyltransferase (adenine-specific)